MSTIATFVQLGFRHIVDVSAMDHILFLVALAAIYGWRDRRDALWVVSAFTVGHSITLALAMTGALTLSSDVIEFLIPVTIVATCIENLFVRGRVRYRPLFAGVFGLVHGAGFANYLRAMFVDHVALPLFGFNIGIEAGQIVVLLAAAAGLTALDRLLEAIRPMGRPTLRLRTVAVSLAVLVVATQWAMERAPW